MRQVKQKLVLQYEAVLQIAQVLIQNLILQFEAVLHFEASDAKFDITMSGSSTQCGK